MDSSAPEEMELRPSLRRPTQLSRLLCAVMAAAATATLTVYRLVESSRDPMTDVDALQVDVDSFVLGVIGVAAVIATALPRRWMQMALLVPAIALATLSGVTDPFSVRVAFFVIAVVGVGALIAGRWGGRGEPT